MRALCISLFLLFLPLVSAAELAISPFTRVSGSAGNPVCFVMNVSVAGSDAVVVRTTWAARQTRSLGDYQYSARDAGLLVEHPEVAWVQEGAVAIPLCIVGETGGVYAGVVLVRPSQGFGGVGSWLTVNLSFQARKERAFTLARAVSFERPFRALVFGGAGACVFLAFILALLLRRLRGHGRNYEYASEDFS